MSRKLPNAHKNCKNSWSTSQSLWASVSMLNMTVYDIVLRKKLNTYGLF